ncbi:MAG: ABC transporter permease [Spirochaetaceae bacterium]|nr:ABC transporter permease [Spirochaetaceae bacterium]
MAATLSTPRAKFSRIIFILTAIFLLLPLVILVATSFNDGRNSWTFFSLRWYRILFTSRPFLWEAFFNSIIVALISAAIATIIGTAAAIAINWYKFKLKTYVQSVNLIALVMPDIVIGLSLAILFSSMSLNLGLFNIILAHISFCIPFVTLIVLARLAEFDVNLLEAADDLGANEWQTLSRVILPMMVPAIIASFITAVTLSLEDFVVTSFVGAVGSTTLPVAINNAIRRDPDANVVYALSVIMIGGTILLAFCSKRFLKQLVQR